MYTEQTPETDSILSNRIHHGNGLIKRRTLFGKSSKLGISLEIWELEQGVSEGDHIHENDKALEEIYYFLTGEGKMDIDGQQISVQAGDAIMVPPGINHGLYNPGTEPLKLMIIWGPPKKS